MKIQRFCIVGVLSVLLCGGIALAQSDTQEVGLQKLPDPWGIGLTYYKQTQPYGIEALQLSGLPQEVAQLIDPKLINTENITKTTHLTFDYWLFPFLNLQVLAGKITSDTDVKLSKVNIGMPLQDLHVKSKGNVYGGGITMAYGYEKIFGTLTAQQTYTDLDTQGSSVKAFVLTPKLGMTLGTKIAAYVGAMYQKPQEKHSGTYDIPPFGTLDYKVKLTNTHKWGYLAGVTFSFTRNVVLTVEGGFGKRQSMMAHIDYRW